ncbi:MAG: uracil-DNA glycosylase [Methylophilus sp.]|uniref:uracil-DNA glycosylase n=1 Tax=Methylophilus sp. TaxID=29541 RepID=UPI003F9EEAC1
MAYESGLGEKLINTLPYDIPGLFNPWKDTCENDQEWNTTGAKLERLESHLNCDARYILCGEAPGFQGCRHTGVAFLSEFLVVENAIPRISSKHERLTKFARPLKEPSATIVWKNLYKLGIQEKVVLWNAVQMHPHEKMNNQSNRKPTKEEIEYGKESLLMLRDYYPNSIFIGVGRIAEGLLQNAGIKAECIRHPANGGATEFASGLSRLVRKQ